MPNESKQKSLRQNAEGFHVYLLVRSHSASDLSGTQAAGAGVHTLGGTVNDRLNAADVGLPAAVGTSVRVGHTDTKGNSLATIFTLCHCSAPPSVTSAVGPNQA